MTRIFPEFGCNPVTGEWNDSLSGKFLWSNITVSEALSDVMTPSTWSLWSTYHVVGCGHTTMFLKIGDRVRVDGGCGIVEMV